MVTPLQATERQGKALFLPAFDTPIVVRSAFNAFFWSSSTIPLALLLG